MQQPTLLLSMEFWDLWWGISVQDEEQCSLAHCDECENWDQTASHINAGIPNTLCLAFSDDAAVFRCAGSSWGWYCDGQASCRGIVFHCEEYDARNPDRRWWSSTVCGALDDTDCKALDNEEGPGIETSQWITTSSDSNRECTPHWSQLEWGWARKTQDSCGEIHFTGWFWSMEGS